MQSEDWEHCEEPESLTVKRLNAALYSEDAPAPPLPTSPKNAPDIGPGYYDGLPVDLSSREEEPADDDDDQSMNSTSNLQDPVPSVPTSARRKSLAQQILVLILILMSLFMLILPFIEIKTVYTFHVLVKPKMTTEISLQWSKEAMNRAIILMLLSIAVIKIVNFVMRCIRNLLPVWNVNFCIYFQLWLFFPLINITNRSFKKLFFRQFKHQQHVYWDTLVSLKWDPLVFLM